MLIRINCLVDLIEFKLRAPNEHGRKFLMIILCIILSNNSHHYGNTVPVLISYMGDEI